MGAKWHDDPLVDWLWKHLALDHRCNIDDFELQPYSYIRGYHEGLHGHIGATYDHEGWSEAFAAHGEWFASTFQ